MTNEFLSDEQIISGHDQTFSSVLSPHTDDEILRSIWLSEDDITESSITGNNLSISASLIGFMTQSSVHSSSIARPLQWLGYILGSGCVPIDTTDWVIPHKGKIYSKVIPCMYS
jgi:hypothetical protein